tara:strand:+ start:136 stop:531 length:396 start_codon:yes stop_codon:yes gene_type:complete
MRITESRLRRIIRDVITESMHDRGPAPDSVEDALEIGRKASEEYESNLAHKESMTQNDAVVKMHNDIETMMKILNTIDKTVIREMVGEIAPELISFAEGLEYEYNSLNNLAMKLVQSNISLSELLKYRNKN